MITRRPRRFTSRRLYIERHPTLRHARSTSGRQHTVPKLTARRAGLLQSSTPGTSNMMGNRLAVRCAFLLPTLFAVLLGGPASAQSDAGTYTTVHIKRGLLRVFR